MIDILSRQEEEALHIAYDKDNINRIKKVADRDVTDEHGASKGPGIADAAENTIRTDEHNMDLERKANIKLLRSEEDSTIWIKWGLDPSCAVERETLPGPDCHEERVRPITHVGIRRCEWKMLNSPRLNQAKKARKLCILARIEATPDVGDHG